MKKIILVAAVMFVSSLAFAKNGGSNPSNVAIKSTSAGFLSESLEHSIRQLNLSNPGSLDSVQDASVLSSGTDQTVVTLTMTDGSAVSYLCSRFDHLSKGGTIVKKEVMCQAQ